MRAEGFVTQPSDLLLNHGIDLSGVWNLVGILDATPDHVSHQAEPQITDALTEAYSVIGHAATFLQPIARQLLGRPMESCGVTPLVVFREVNSGR
jgi:hypothetical protein